MTTTVFESTGVGVHTQVRVMRDGKCVGQIFNSNRPPRWRIQDGYYHSDLKGGFRSLAAAKAVAEQMVFPSTVQVYEMLKAKAEAVRRAEEERHQAHVLAEIARDILAGSNSAHQRLTEIIGKIEAYAKDLNGGRAVKQPDGSWCGQSGVQYPDPPPGHPDWAHRSAD